MTTRFDPTRRGLLAAGLLAAIARAGVARGARPEDDREAEEVAERARQAGLGAMRRAGGGLYRVLGDAPERFLRDALRLCEGLQKDYLEHFRGKGFDVERPTGRLTVVVLSGPESYAAYLGIPPGEADGGHYERTTNRLVMFDNRARDRAGAGSARANTIALLHEAAHQLAYNTGLLDRRADVPGWVDEGLAMYAEVRSPDGKRKVGAVNEDRLPVLLDGRAPPPRVVELVASDAALDDPAREEAAYALSWLLVYRLLQPSHRAAFRAYLEALRKGRPAGGRLRDAEEAFGDLGRLDEELRQAARGLAARRR